MAETRMNVRRSTWPILCCEYLPSGSLSCVHRAIEVSWPFVRGLGACPENLAVERFAPTGLRGRSPDARPEEVGEGAAAPGLGVPVAIDEVFDIRRGPRSEEIRKILEHPRLDLLFRRIELVELRRDEGGQDAGPAAGRRAVRDELAYFQVAVGSADLVDLWAMDVAGRRAVETLLAPERGFVDTVHLRHRAHVRAGGEVDVVLRQFRGDFKPDPVTQIGRDGNDHFLRLNRQHLAVHVNFELAKIAIADPCDRRIEHEAVMVVLPLVGEFIRKAPRNLSCAAEQQPLLR